MGVHPLCIVLVLLLFLPPVCPCKSRCVSPLGTRPAGPVGSLRTVGQTLPLLLSVLAGNSRWYVIVLV